MPASLAFANRAFALAILAVAAAACTNETREPEDTTAATAATAAAAPFTSPVQNIPAATIFAALNAQGRWQKYPDQVDRDCKGAQCAGGAAHTSVALWAEVNAIRADFRDAADTAILIGKLHNLGGHTEARYNLARGKRYAVYLMKEGTLGRYEIWETDGSNKAMVNGGQYIECGHPDLASKWPHSFGVFTSCQETPELEAIQPGPFLRLKRPARPGPVAAAGAPGASHSSGPAWFTCKSGCCTAGPE